MWNFLLNLQSVCDSRKTDDMSVCFFCLHSADADVVGMVRYCNAISDRLENLSNFYFQKEKGQFQHRTLPCPIYTSNP